MDLTVAILLSKISSTELLKTVSVCVLLVALHVLFLFGFISGLFVTVSYVVGFYVFHFLIQYSCNVGDILSLLTGVILKKLWPNLPGNQTLQSKREDILIVPLDIDNALDQFANRIFSHYLSHWYANISVDTSCPREIRIIVQNAVSNCYRRLSEVGADAFILKKILPICLNHIHTYDKLETDAYVSHLHIAVHSRTTELLYLQNVSKSVMKYILKESELRCHSFSVLLREVLARNLFLALSDTVCNPDILNPLLLHFLKGHYNFLSTERCDDVQRVVLLDKFVSALKSRPLYSCLQPDLAMIFKDDDLREAFMRYLRTKAVDHMLQFCIDIEIFKDKLSQQNFCSKTEELDHLYRDAWDLYSVYFSSHSPNCIQFKEDYASILRKALSKDILKLENTRTLSDAYDYVYAQLENYCLDFHSSNEFYFWFYGRFEPSELVKSQEILQLDDETVSGTTPERKTGFELSDKLNIIKGVLKSNQILEGQVQEASDAETSMELGEDVKVTVSSSERNMNSWKISIPTVGTRLDPITSKAYTVFVIQTQTESGADWLVERRPNDFYSLDVKLTEFHGSFRDVQLPPRRLMTSRSECLQMYEDYLNKMVKITALKSSDLLSTFLSSPEDFEEEETGFSKLFRKSVVPTLRKERGQNLDTFINSFISSCRMTKYEWRDVGETRNSKKSKSKNQIYGNNFGVNPDISQHIFYTQVPPHNNIIFEKSSTSILYLGIRLFNIQDKIVKFLLTLQSFFGGMIDQLMMHFVKHLLSHTLTISNIAYIINLTEKAVFGSKQKLNSEEIKLDLTNTLDTLKPNRLHPFYVLLYESLQNARLNKQLYYQVMDVVLEELFPELNEVSRR